MVITLWMLSMPIYRYWLVKWKTDQKCKPFFRISETVFWTKLIRIQLVSKMIRKIQCQDWLKVAKPKHWNSDEKLFSKFINFRFILNLLLLTWPLKIDLFYRTWFHVKSINWANPGNAQFILKNIRKNLLQLGT